MSDEKSIPHVVSSSPMTYEIGTRDSQYSIAGVPVTKSIFERYKEHDHTPELIAHLKQLMNDLT